jgi:glycosyltransferase involved in cell wall biosynthesis
MRILISLTYYRPHVSGLTIYVERLARGLVGRGHEVTLLTSCHDPELPREEALGGVDVIRIPVALSVAKGALMPAYPTAALRLARRHDAVSVHAPQFEAPVLALAARALRKPCVLTYHCDVRLPDGAVNRVAEGAVAAANSLTAALASRVVAYTRDYANHTPLLRRHRRKLAVIPPPVEMAAPVPADVEALRAEHTSADTAGPVLGFAARFAAEKGVETLLEALPALISDFPGLIVMFAGPAAVGEDAYRRRLAPAVAAVGERWRALGLLDPVREMPTFYGAVDCLVVPSLNSTESFGLVQGEAMLCGTPVVVSDLPGVREPVRWTGMGEIVPVGDPTALADAIRRVLVDPTRYSRPREEVARYFAVDACLDRYEALLADELRR